MYAWYSSNINYGCLLLLKKVLRAGFIATPFTGEQLALTSSIGSLGNNEAVSVL